MYKISDCHLSFVSAAVTFECVLCFEIVEIRSIAYICQQSRCMLNILVPSLIERERDMMHNKMSGGKSTFRPISSVKKFELLNKMSFNISSM